MTTEVDPKQDPRFKAATLALTEVQRAIRFLHLYPSDHPFCTRALDDVVARVESYLGEHGALDVAIVREGVALDEVTILKDQAQSTDLATLLYPEGVRQLTLQPAVTRQELLDFVQILSTRHAEHESQESGGGVDLVTALWRRDFQHIACHIQDDLSPARVRDGQEDALAPLARRIVVLSGAIARGHDERHAEETNGYLHRREQFRRKGLLDSDGGANLGALPDPPPEYHQTELAASRAKLLLEALDPTRSALLDRVTKLILWAVRRKEGAPAPQDVAQFVAGAALGLLAQGEVRRATDLVATVAKGHPDRDVFASAISEKLARDRALAVLAQALEKHGTRHGVEAASALAAGWLALLDAPSLRRVCVFYGSIEREEARRAFRPFLVARAKDDPDGFAELTQHKSRAVVLEGFTLLAQAGKGTRAWQLLEEAARDTTHAQRAGAAQEALDAATGVKQRRELLGVIEHGPDKAHRIMAALNLTPEIAGPQAFDSLSALVQSSAFAKRDDDEIEAVLAAFARVGRLRCVRVLTELAAPKKTTIFGRKGANALSQLAQEQLVALKSMSAATARETARLSPIGPGSGRVPVGVDPAATARATELTKRLGEDPDRVNRGNALRELLALKLARTFDDLCAIALAPDFCLREQDEIQEHLGAIAELGKQRAARVLQELAGRKSSVFRRRETQRLATLAGEALAALERGSA